jgi:hypothetical protein
MRKPDLGWVAYVFYGVPVVGALAFIGWMLFSMYFTLWFGEETYDCVRALC